MMHPSDESLQHLQAHVGSRLRGFLADLEHLVGIESGTYSKAGVDRVGTWVAERLQALGATVERHAHDTFGDTIVATFEGPEEGPTVLLIGHADTVFEDGYLARRPFEVSGGRVHGPGAGDMKSGLLLGLYAVEALRAAAPDEDAWLPVGRLIFIVNPDEEIGSPTSSAVIAEQAQDADAALVLEAAQPNGDIVSARKGVLHLRATLRGRAAHAGVEPEKGRSAVLEAAHKTVALHQLNGRWEGVSVVVGSMRGGTRPNIVPDEAVLQIDMRAPTTADRAAAEAEMRAILGRSTVPDVATSVEVGADWQPMERSEASGALVEQAQVLARRLGFEVHGATTGGGSDANTTAALGVPTIDGLGPVGGAHHTTGEYVEVDSIVPRTVLLAGLLASFRRSPQEPAPSG